MTTIVLDIVLGFLAAIIVAWFSRQREFRADAVLPSQWPPPAHDQRLWPAWAACTRRTAQERGRHGHCRCIGKAVQHPPAH